jgi:hypothetical protein
VVAVGEEEGVEEEGEEKHSLLNSRLTMPFLLLVTVGSSTATNVALFGDHKGMHGISNHREPTRGGPPATIPHCKKSDCSKIHTQPQTWPGSLDK